MKNSLFARWQANFWAGLAIVLPAVISVAVLLWLFDSIANITDALLIFLPPKLTHRNEGAGPMYWYWSLVALLLAVLLIAVVGLLARNYFGKKIIEWVDSALLRIPLLNKIYSATKQVNDAFSTGNKTSFRTVVLVEFPHPGAYSLGFLTSEPQGEIRTKSTEKLVCVFVPATPNPTSGFLLLLPEEKVSKLEMSVADGIKYVISLGSIIPEAKVVELRSSAAEQGEALRQAMIELARGLILRTRPLTETSLIVHWLTPDVGRIATVAKGARRPKSPFRGRLDLFYLADISFSRSSRSDLHNLREVSLLETHSGLRDELRGLEQACYCAQLLELSTEMETPLPGAFELMLAVLRHLVTHPAGARAIFAFELKLLDQLGLRPDPAQADLDPATVQLVKTLLESDWASLENLKAQPTQVRKLGQFLHGFLIYHLGRIPTARPISLPSVQAKAKNQLI